jgi:predicted amidohydrolase YtcJ/Tol biopolymer transport system component
MRRDVIATALATAALAVAAAGAAPRAKGKADLVLRGGIVHTVDPKRPRAEAVAIAGGRIVAVGSEADVGPFVGPATRVVELAGRTVVPGLREGHGHLMSLGFSRLSLDLNGTNSYREIVAKVAEAVKGRTPGEWVLGRGWHESKWTERPAPEVRNFPTHDALSAVSPDNPVLLERADGHAALANAKAMALAGIGRDTKAPEGGEIIRDERGEPTGILVDNAADLVSVPPPDAARSRRALETALEECVRKGLTSFTDAGASLDEIALYEEYAAAGRLPLRLYVMVRGYDALRRLGRPQVGLGGGFLTLRSVKLSADGAMGSRGAALLETYHDDPGHSGFFTTPPEVVLETARYGLAHGWQVNVHAIGDRANRMVLDAFEKAFAERPAVKDPRFRIEHAQILDAADIPRFGRLGVIASMQGIHQTSDRPWAPDRLGMARVVEGLYVWRKLFDAGARILNGTDAPVEDVDPIKSFYASVARQDEAGHPPGGWEPDQRMTREEALRSYTLDGAYGSFEERELGSIEVGKRADLTVLTKDILSVALPEILRAEVAMTIVEGKVRYDKAAAPADAGRQPVLKQIAAPHPYYYREMYLPQVTSGPSAAAWSPDGRELAYAMQGTLWRQALDSDRARQLTDGPGYHHQPDWSPDGRFLAYASYTGDAVELRLLELATGRTLPLTSNGAVNVEPRWSPDGTRLAFVSTLDRGRWQIHVLEVGADGSPGRLTRLTGETDSALPRYYYSRYDHALSPTWSPDGKELIFVSNRGRIWGTGGLWRMNAEPAAAAREIRQEETNWRARPDWAKDGRRVAYASYLGRNWHQLWVTTAAGGDPFPLSYGDFDVTNPRWSPDGTRIAFVSNQDGNTSLWVQALPGGERSRIETRERRYLNPTARLALEVVDASGRAVPARVSVTGPDGRSYVPDDAWRHADDAFDRAERRFEYAYFHASGRAELTVPAGRVAVEVLRGLEHRPVRQEVSVSAGETARLRVVLERIADLPADGWWSGDLHVHMNYGGHYRNTPERLAFQAAAEDLHVVENLIVNKEQRIPDVAYFDGGRPDPASGERVLIAHGQEFHTSLWGHTGLLGLTSHLLIPDYAAYVNTAAASLHPMNATVADLARAQGALLGYVHPFDAEPDPADRERPLTNELPVDVALGKVDYYEALGFEDDHLATARVWYRLLNCGFRVPAGAGTDAMANYASLRGPVGMNRVYAKTGAFPDRERWLAAIKAGRSFATNGPLLRFSLDGREAGDELALPARGGALEAHASLASIVPVDRLEIVGNGRVAATVPVTGDRTAADARLRLRVRESGWYLLRAYALRSRHPVLDIYPYATTSPIYVTVGGGPARSRPDAEYFVAWIRRVEEAAAAHDGYNAPAERERVLATLAAGRAVFERLAASS